MWGEFVELNTIKSGLAWRLLFLLFRRLAGNREGLLECAAHVFQTRVMHPVQPFTTTLLEIDNGAIGIVCHSADPPTC